MALDLRQLTKEQVLDATIAELKNRGVSISLEPRSRLTLFDNFTEEQLRTVVADGGEIKFPIPSPRED